MAIAENQITLEVVRDGEGTDGTTFTPSVNEAGIISWTNDGGKANPTPKNIKGPQGEDGQTVKIFKTPYSATIDNIRAWASQASSTWTMDEQPKHADGTLLSVGESFYATVYCTSDGCTYAVGLVVRAVYTGNNVPTKNAFGYFKVAEKGAQGQGVFKSIVFKRASSQPSTPTGGSYSSPIPSGWSDGVSSGTEQIWMSTRVFTSDGESPQTAAWTTPNMASDTPDVDFEYSSVANNPGNPTDDPVNWSDAASESSIWMAVRKKSAGAWSSWDISKIKGERGPQGYTPYIGSNGNWWINDEDMGYSAEGDDGHSPYVNTATNTWWEWDTTRSAYQDTHIVPQGPQGGSIKTSVSREGKDESWWSAYGDYGHPENWSNTESIRNGCVSGDLFTVVGTSTAGKAHQYTYICDNNSGDLHGVCISHLIANRGAIGPQGEMSPEQIAQLNTASTNASSALSQLANKEDSWTKSIYVGSAGNPRPVKFCSINYSNCTSETGVLIKMSAVSGHGNGVSYTFLEDIFIGVSYTGVVTVDVLKNYDSSCGSYDGATRAYGDVFYTKDTTNKIVDVFILAGQYSTVRFTPFKRLNSSNGGTITQLTSLSLYSSGTKTYANNNLYANSAEVEQAAKTATNYLYFDNALYVTDNTQTRANAVRIDSDSVDIIKGGNEVASFSDTYVELAKGGIDALEGETAGVNIGNGALVIDSRGVDSRIYIEDSDGLYICGDKPLGEYGDLGEYGEIYISTLGVSLDYIGENFTRRAVGVSEDGVSIDAPKIFLWSASTAPMVDFDTENHGLTIDGNKILTTADVGTVITKEGGTDWTTNLSSGTNTVKNIASITVPRGTWIIMARCRHDPSSSGGRHTSVGFSTTSQSETTQDRRYATGTHNTQHNLSGVYSFSGDNNTIYLTGQATASGNWVRTNSSLRIIAVKVG